eukprot:606745-Rhodomonas_salina.2
MEGDKCSVIADRGGARTMRLKACHPPPIAGQDRKSGETTPASSGIFGVVRIGSALFTGVD